ncbi:MAG: F0F1 ATP synthase subunit delta [Dokdonella sp.]
MSSALTLARPYARAAFEIARERGALGEWAAKLTFAAQVAADPGVTSLLGNPRVSMAQLGSLMLADGEAADSDFSVFVRMLADSGRVAVLPEIGALFEALKLESERMLKVQVRAASVIGNDEIEKLKQALKRRFGRDIEISQSLDESLIGGAVIDAGDVVIDGSVRGSLAALEKALVH